MSSISDYSVPPSWQFEGMNYEFNYAIDNDGRTKIWSQLSSEDRKAAHDTASKLLKENTRRSVTEVTSIFRMVITSGSVEQTAKETSQIAAFHFALARPASAHKFEESEKSDSPTTGSDSNSPISRRSSSVSSNGSVSPPPLLSQGLLAEGIEIIQKMEKTFELQTINDDIELLIDKKYQIETLKDTQALETLNKHISTFLSTRYSSYSEFVDKTISELQASHDLDTIQEKMNNLDWARSRLEECGQVAAKLDSKLGCEEHVKALNEKVALFFQERVKSLYDTADSWFEWLPKQNDETPIPNIVEGLEALQSVTSQLVLLDKQWAWFKENADPNIVGYQATLEFLKSEKVTAEDTEKFINDNKKFLIENQNSPIVRLEKNNRFFDYERLKLLGKIPDSSWKKYEAWLNSPLKSPEQEKIPKGLVQEFRAVLKEERDFDNFRYYLAEMIEANRKKIIDTTK